MANEKTAASLRAYQLIKGRIIRRELDPRQRLNELELSRELKISRTPVREALIMLEKDDLVTRYDGSRGFYLRNYSIRDIEELYDFREIVEIASSDSVIGAATDQDIQRMAKILADVQDIIDQNRPPEALVRALDFHLYCVQLCSKNAFILSTLRNCYEKLVVISWTCQDLNACVASAMEHERMWNAIRLGNREMFVEMTRQHIHGARDRMIHAIKLDTNKLYFLR
jgi:DNA-binding GntR family transcriptional regulator